MGTFKRLGAGETARSCVAAAAAVVSIAGAAAPARAAITYSFTPSATVDPGQAGANVVTLDNFSTIDVLPQTSYYIAGGARTDCAAITSNTTSCNSAIGSPPSVNGTPDLAGPPGSPNFLAISTAPTGVSGGSGSSIWASAATG